MYQKALALEPNFPEAYNNLGNALREAGRSEEAIACYTACIQLQYTRAGASGGMPVVAHGRATGIAPAAAQRLSVAYNNLGGILKMTGQAMAAIVCYEQVALLQPESPEAHANLASAYKVRRAGGRAWGAGAGREGVVL
jgi:protein O-GlcNAc transferase